MNISNPGRLPVSLLLLLASLFTIAGACTSDPTQGPTMEVRDSAGVTLVENRGELPPGEGVWTVGSEPLVSIGTFQGDTLYQLYEVSGAVRLADGRIGLANRGTGEVRIYGPDGRFLMSHGRKGEGPGEFQSPALAGVLGTDTLVVVDYQLRRISLVGAANGFLEATRVEEGVGGALYPSGVLADRTILVGGGFSWSSDSGVELTDGYTRPPTTYQSVNLDGTLAHDFGEFPGSEFFMQVQRSGGGIAMSARLIPFGRHPMEAAFPTGMYFGSGDSWEIEVYDLEGRLVRLVRWDRSPQSVTDVLLDSYIQEQEAEAGGNEAREIRQQISEMPVPETMPAFGGLHADDLGYLWVERSRIPGDEVPVFDIFDSEGALTAQATLPEGSELLHVREDEILVLVRDDLGVEYLRLFSLARETQG